MSAPLHLIELSVRFKNGNYVVGIEGTDVEMPNARFEAFVHLVLARLTTESGITALRSICATKNRAHTTICRLRCDIDQYLGEGAGLRLIRHAARSFYYLDLPREQILICQSVADLAPHHISQAIVDDLMQYAQQNQFAL